mgnify:CR=1 FL=1
MSTDANNQNWTGALCRDQLSITADYSNCCIVALLFRAPYYERTYKKGPIAIIVESLLLCNQQHACNALKEIRIMGFFFMKGQRNGPGVIRNR